LPYSIPRRSLPVRGRAHGDRPTTSAVPAIARSARRALRACGKRPVGRICCPWSTASAIIWYNKAAIYGVLFDAAAETLRTITADLGIRAHINDHGDTDVVRDIE
jgi:hypothetical protein